MQIAPLDARRDSSVTLNSSSLLADDGHSQNVSIQRHSEAVGLHFEIWVSYIEYIAHTTGDNEFTTKSRDHAGYIKDTRGRTVDRCWSGRVGAALAAGPPRRLSSRSSTGHEASMLAIVACAPSESSLCQAPVFDGILGATDRAAIMRRGCVEFVWVRE
jgi:hypothetical protein